jgi:pyruvate dehydrogenase E2 component (dihydrolipoamide acetyltransferase)
MQEEGFIARILYPDGAKDVLLGEALAILVDDEKDIAAFADWVAGGAPEPEAVVEVEATPEASIPTGSMSKAQSGDRQFVSPIAARIAKEKGLDLSTVTGTGPNFRIILADVEEALKAGPVKVA